MKLPMRTDLQIYMSTESESLAIKTIMLWLCGVLCPRANMPDIVKWMRSFVVCVCVCDQRSISGIMLWLWSVACPRVHMSDTVK